MDQREFLSQLIDELKYLKPKDANEVVKFYQQKISTALDYGEKEEKVIANLPSPKKIAEDIYKTKGIAYIDLRKKEMKRQAKFSFVGAILLSIIIAAVFAVVTYIFVSMSINLLKIIFQTNNFEILDSIMLIITSIMILLIEIIVYIYFIDLCYLMIIYFISNPIYQLTNKKLDQKITDFTISGFINKKIKHEKSLLKLAIILVFIGMISGITNYITKGYLYRSGQNITSNIENYTIDNNSIEKIVYHGEKANFTITTDNTINNIEITYYHEFNHNFELLIENNILTIKFNDNKNFDILNILKEPTQTIVIKIPTTYPKLDVELSITEANINLLSANLKDVNIKNVTGTYQIFNSNINNLSIKTNKGVLETVSKEEQYEDTTNNINELNIDFLDGQINLSNILGNKFTLTNSTSKISIKKINYNEIIINSRSGEITLDEVMINDLNYDVKSTICTISNSKINKTTLCIQATSSLTINQSIVNNIDESFVSGSYLILEYVKLENITLESNNGTIFLYNLSEEIKDPKTNINLEYNELDILPNINITKSENSKIAIDSECITYVENNKELNKDLINIKTLNIVQTNGTISIKTTKISDMSLDLNDVNIELQDVYGNPYYVTTKAGYLTFKNEIDTEQKLYLKRNISTQVEISNNIKKVENE